MPDDPATLKAIILAQRAEAERMAASVRAYKALIQALKIRIAKIKRRKFGPSSKKIEREIDQLQLALEDLEVAMATAEAKPEPTRLRQPPRRQLNASCSTPAKLPGLRWALAPGGRGCGGDP